MVECQARDLEVRVRVPVQVQIFLLKFYIIFLFMFQNSPVPGVTAVGTMTISLAKRSKEHYFGKTLEDETLVRQWIEYAVCYGSYVDLTQTARQVLKVNRTHSLNFRLKRGERSDTYLTHVCSLSSIESQERLDKTGAFSQHALQ